VPPSSNNLAIENSNIDNWTMPKARNPDHRNLKKPQVIITPIRRNDGSVPVKVNYGDRALMSFDGGRIAEIIPFSAYGSSDANLGISIVGVGEAKFAWNDLKVMIAKLFSGIDEVSFRAKQIAIAFSEVSGGNLDAQFIKDVWQLVVDNAHKVEEHRSAELELKTTIEFIPSLKIIEILERGVEKFVKEKMDNSNTPSRVKNLSLAGTRADRKEVIRTELKALIASQAFRVADGREPNIPLTKNGEFNSLYLNIFLDMFPIWPTDLGVFQETLLLELRGFLAAGGSYSGSWGNLLLKDNEIVVMIGKDTVERMPKRNRQKSFHTPA
jgi:hypothetical protein